MLYNGDFRKARVYLMGKQIIIAATLVLVASATNLPAKKKKATRAPSVMLQSQQGGVFNLRNHMKKLNGSGYTAFAFFSVTCIPCEKELPDLQRLWQKYGEAGFHVYMISVDSGDDFPRSRTRKFLRSLNVAMPLLYDERRQAGRNYGIIDENGEAVLPALFVIDANRNIILRKIGYSKKTIRKLGKLLKKRL